ncbi:MAG: SpoIIE family protein phosphatase [Roseiflexaceae bacterium]
MRVLQAPQRYIEKSFRRKLLLFVLLAVVITTVLQFVFLINNFRTVTDFALQQNTAGMEQTVEEFLTNYAREKATTTDLQLQAAQDDLRIVARSAQVMIDTYPEIRANPTILNLSIYRSQTQDDRGALISGPDDPFQLFVQPKLATDQRTLDLLETSALLNPVLQGVYEANRNNNFVYFVGDEQSPITRGYPNIRLTEAVPDPQLLDLDFWNDYFPGAVEGWTRWYSDPSLREAVPSPVTVIGPYADAAGQGLVMTMFYPLWDNQEQRFAGAAAADIKLDSIIQNILSFKVARTGFAFLMNGKGEVIAMPETGFQLFGINLTQMQQGSLVYYRGELSSSNNSAVQQMARDILANEEGTLKVNLQGSDGQIRTEIISYASLPALSGINYESDRWRIVLAVPEDEVFEVLNATDRAVNEERVRMSLFSSGIVLASLVLVTLISIRFSGAATQDLRTLATAANQLSAKRYDVDLKLQSNDEIGQLGRAFSDMALQIRDYTNNLEAKVAERTADLQQANREITRLNEQLRGENLRLGAELDVARRIQMMVLPPEQETRAISALDIACFMRPADEVGGDYYDVLQVGDAVYLGIGDVTGHGLPAGIIMLMAQTAFLTLSQSGERDMQRIVSVLNSVLYRNIGRIQEDKNMTLAVLEYRNQNFTVVGQHESVLICRANGQIEVVDTLDLGLPMGLEEDITGFVTARQLRLESNDVMVLYTDGVTEAENHTREQYGLEKLANSLNQHRSLEASEIRNRVMSDLYAFIGETRIYDDISLLVIKQR